MVDKVLEDVKLPEEMYIWGRPVCGGGGDGDQHYCHFLTDLIKHVDKPRPFISI